VKQWPPKVLIVGHSGAGKDEFAKMLAKASGLTYAGSMSAVIAEHLAKLEGTTAIWQMQHRHDDRAKWFRVGNELRATDPCALLKEGFARGDILTGARNKDEVTLGLLLVNWIVWIQRKVERDPTLEYSLRDLPPNTWVIPNHKGLRELEAMAIEFSDHIKKGATP
jgi:hypothetical protein